MSIGRGIGGSLSRRRSTRAAALGAGLSLLTLYGHAAGQTLDQALGQAYVNNPTLDAQRAQLRATDELVPQALSNYRPQVQATGTGGIGLIDVAHAKTVAAAAGKGWERLDPASVGVTVTQPVYRGGQTEAQTRQAENLVQAQRATLATSEITILGNAAQAYIDVVQAQSVLALDRNNEQVLRRQLESTRDQFSVGQVTRTDVSQAEAALAQGISTRIQAEGTLATAQAAYTQVVGSRPGTLAAPVLHYALPASEDETVALARHANPQVITAQFNEAAAQDAIRLSQGQLYPQVSVVGSVARNWDSTTPNTQINTASVAAQVTVPIYTNGSIASQIRQANQTATQRRVQINEAERQVVDNAVTAWQALQTARAVIKADQAQVEATQIALDGTQQEQQVGSRTILDVLNAQQAVLSAQTQLVQAQHNEVVAVFQVLSATGGLSAKAIGLKVPAYDEEANYRAVRNKWWGTGISN